MTSHKLSPLEPKSPNVGDNVHRRRAAGGVVVLLLMIAVIAGGVIASRSGEESSERVAARQRPAAQVSPQDPSPVRDDLGEPVPEGFTGVVDSQGVPRGFVSDAESTEALDNGEPTLTLGGGQFTVNGFKVVDREGNLTGYLVSGAIGFVDKATADDPEQFAALLADDYRLQVKHQARAARDLAELLEEMKGDG